MEIKNIKSATYLCYTTQTTLNKLKDIAPAADDKDSISPDNKPLEGF